MMAVIPSENWLAILPYIQRYKEENAGDDHPG